MGVDVVMEIFGRYLRKNRERICPWVKDWTDPHDELRNCKNVKELSWEEWYYFHPSAYKMITYGSNALTMFVLSVIALSDFLWGSSLRGSLTLFLVFFLGLDLWGKLKVAHLYKRTTFFDLHMRDY